MDNIDRPKIAHLKMTSEINQAFKVVSPTGFEPDADIVSIDQFLLVSHSYDIRRIGNLH